MILVPAAVHVEVWVTIGNLYFTQGMTFSYVDTVWRTQWKAIEIISGKDYKVSSKAQANREFQIHLQGKNDYKTIYYYPNLQLYSKSLNNS